MKCKRCKHEMKRTKTNTHKYVYRCPYCGYTVGDNTQNVIESDTAKNE